MWYPKKDRFCVGYVRKINSIFKHTITFSKNETDNYCFVISKQRFFSVVYLNISLSNYLPFKTNIRFSKHRFTLRKKKTIAKRIIFWRKIIHDKTARQQELLWIDSRHQPITFNWSHQSQWKIGRVNVLHKGGNSDQRTRKL